MANHQQDGWAEVFRHLGEWIEDPPGSLGEALGRLRAMPERVVEKRPDREGERRNQLTYSALLGVAVFAIIQLLPLAQLDAPLTISAISFAVSVPCLAGTVYIITTARRSDHEYDVETRWTFLMDLAGILLSFAGIAGLFWHLWWVAGVLFVVCSVAAFAVFVHHAKASEEVNSAKTVRHAKGPARPPRNLK
jgi:hypothetical protein